MKLRTKIWLFSSLLMLVMIALVNTSIYFLFYKIATDNELDGLARQTNGIIEAINANQDIPESEILKAFLPADGMIRIIAENGDEVIPTITKKKDYIVLPFVFSPKEIGEIVSDEALGKVAVISKPIIWSDGSVVTLRVSKQLVAHTQTMQTLLYVLLAASLFILVPTVIGANVLGRFVLQPINTLITTMQDNTKQDKWVKMEMNSKSNDELDKMETTFNEMIDHLQMSFEKQEAFVSDASHELKTPISIIKSYAQLLTRRGKSNPEVFEESVAAIDSEADRMQGLVEQLLLLAKNKESMVYESVDLVELVQHTMRPFQTTSNRKIVLDVRAADTFVSGDKKQLQQILYILISNALKYSDTDVKVILDMEDENVVLNVIDHGAGISKDDQLRIFDRFYRVDKARARSTGGTGLGLAIAKQIAEVHDGALSVQSVQDVGTTFSVRIPIIQ